MGAMYSDRRGDFRTHFGSESNPNARAKNFMMTTRILNNFFMRNPTLFCACAFGAALLINGPIHAETQTDTEDKPTVTQPDWYSLHIQGTYTSMGHGSFHSQRADGAQSMMSKAQMDETADVTLFAGVRLGEVELYFNPEMDQGFGPSNTVGMAGYVSGEAYKVGQYDPYYRTPRLFGRYVYGLGGETQTVEDGPNQLAGNRDADAITVTIGKFGIPDIFDTNIYAHDPRSDFLNWAVAESGAFDYAAEAWGYSYGGAVEWTQDWWTVRAGFFNMSRWPNSKRLQTNFRNNQSILEAEERHDLMGQPGKIKLLAFVTNAKMGSYADAIAAGVSTGQTPTTASVRRYQLRPGGGINLEQQLTPSLGAFLKASMNDGQYEAYDFTEINQSLTTGVSLKGTDWGREDDTIGLAGLINGISSDAQRYLALGGLGILIGDGSLPRYGSEKIIEAYYKATLRHALAITADYQHVENPAYNATRGPVDFWGLRMHAEY